MRTLALIRGDIRFQYKYGFYLLYLLFSLLYVGLLFAFPQSWREKAAVLMIYTDPAAMGLFFMGAIVLFEKNERVLDSLAISPVKPWEYVFSKLVSIGLVSTLVALAIGIPAGVVTHPLRFITGVFLCSCLFSSVGLFVACKISSLNQFILATVPAEIIIVAPAVVWLFWQPGGWLALHPGVSMMMLCMTGKDTLGALALLLGWTALFAAAAIGAVKKMFQTLGGVRL